MRDKAAIRSILLEVSDKRPRRVQEELERFDPNLRWVDTNEIAFNLMYPQAKITEMLFQAMNNPHIEETQQYIDTFKKEKEELCTLYAQAVKDTSRGVILVDWFIEDTKVALNKVLSSLPSPQQEYYKEYFKNLDDKFKSIRRRNDENKPPLAR